MSLPVHVVDSLVGVRVGSTVAVTGAEARHAVAVRRLRPGERLALTDGAGSRAEGTVATAVKGLLEVTVDTLETVPPGRPRVAVAQAIPKGERAELAVEVLTEVGVDQLIAWSAARCVAVWRGDRAAKSLARWRSAAREAAKQARRSWFPQVSGPATTAELCRLIQDVDLAVVLHEGADEAWPDLPVGPADSVLVVVGPEGGITDDELSAFRAAGAHVVRLGPEVLRTSTAGLAAVSALLSRTDRWR